MGEENHISHCRSHTESLVAAAGAAGAAAAATATKATAAGAWQAP